MNFSRAHDRLVSFAVSAMITSAFLATAPAAVITAAAGPQPAAVMNALSGLRAAGWSGLQNVAVPAPAAAPQTAPDVPAVPQNPLLTDIQIGKLLKLTIDHGHDASIEKQSTDALGITSGDEILTVRQVTVIVNPQLSRAFQKVPNDGGYLFGDAYPDGGFKIYRTNAKQELIAAVEVRGDQAPVAIPFPDAQQQLKVEIAYWGMIANKF